MQIGGVSTRIDDILDLRAHHVRLKEGLDAAEVTFAKVYQLRETLNAYSCYLANPLTSDGQSDNDPRHARRPARAGNRWHRHREVGMVPRPHERQARTEPT